MKKINKLLKGGKSNKISTATKLLIPVAGAVAAKKLWDKNGTAIVENIRSKILDKTEQVQEKVQKFHDFVENASNESMETEVVDETMEEDVEEDAFTQAVEGEDADENNQENMEEPKEDNEEVIAEAEEIEKESENN